jgi:hypothetical protein
LTNQNGQLSNWPIRMVSMSIDAANIRTILKAEGYII